MAYSKNINHILKKIFNSSVPNAKRNRENVLKSKSYCSS